MIAKEGVDLRDLAAPAWWGAHLADQLHQKITAEQIVITSTGEGKHSVTRSQHYRGEWRGYGRAFDCRVWYLDNPQEFAEQLTAELGAEYYVQLAFKADGQPSHIHVHWSPPWQ